MKYFALTFSVLSCFVGWQAFAEEKPHGNFLELHSCELYAGGCIVSSEATLGGRYMLRAWNFTGGRFQGTDLAGLNLALLQSSSDNLAMAKSDPGQGVVYLPETASSEQREALLSWLKYSPGAVSANLSVRPVSIRFVKKDQGYAVSVGDSINVRTAGLETCATGACGEALWYSPRSETSVFTVALDQSSSISEPFLSLKWNDAGRRTVFLGRFGEDSAGRSLFVNSIDLCGNEPALF